MIGFNQVYASLRRKNIRQYILLVGCCFVSVLLITAYVCMMRSPTVLNVLPVGGDSRKQVMMVFVMAVIGCGMFTTYASGLFFRYKSRETGIFMALGASRRQIKRLLSREIAIISFTACAGGVILGAPLAWLIWRLFRLLLVDTQEMTLILDWQALLFALAFSVFVMLMLFIMMTRFIRRTNIMDIVNESRKSEPVREVPRYYGLLGIVLLLGGFLLGYLTPGFFIRVLRWYAPDVLTSLAYLPALAGLHMLLLHTVVNGWRGGKNRYKRIVSTSMMRFQGRQTVRNMLVITMLVAGAYFASFYTPVTVTGVMMGFDARKTDYAFHYRADQNMPVRDEIEQIAAEEGVTLTSYAQQPAAVLGVDGQRFIEEQSSLGATYRHEYTELLRSRVFFSESAYNALTGDTVDVAAGSISAIYNNEGNSGYVTTKDIHVVTNTITGEVLRVQPNEGVIRNSMLLGSYVLNDADYAQITAGLSDTCREEYVFFNVENVETTYDFAKRLFHEIVERSGPEVVVFDAWDPVEKMLADQMGEAYRFDSENLTANGFEAIEYELRDSSSFRLYWKYMPQFRVLDKADFVKTFAVFLMLFVFIAIVCFSAVIVIAYTRSITIGMTNAHVYHDLRRLGASNSYMLTTLKGQISKVFFVPICTGTAITTVLYTMILFFNDGRFSAGEITGMLYCLALITVISVLLYCIYRMTLKKVCVMLGILR